MNDYANPKTKNKSSALWIFIAFLIVIEFCAVALLGSQIMNYASVPQRNYISLTEGTANSKLGQFRKDGAVNSDLYSSALLMSSEVGFGSYYLPAPLAVDPGFTVYDENVVWTTDTEVEIFKIQYDNNGDLVYTVNSFNNQDKVIAPGTSNDYTFTLKNTSKYPLSYKLQVDAWITGGDYVIPLEAKMYDYQGNYQVGSVDEWAPALELDPVEVTGALSVNNIADYTIQWQWPFERTTGEGLDANDEFDTILGNLAANDEALEFHIRIYTEAEITEDEGGDPPKPTGDKTAIFFTVAVAALVPVIIIVTLGKRKKKA